MLEDMVQLLPVPAMLQCQRWGNREMQGRVECYRTVLRSLQDLGQLKLAVTVLCRVGWHRSYWASHCLPGSLPLRSIWAHSRLQPCVKQLAKLISVMKPMKLKQG